MFYIHEPLALMCKRGKYFFFFFYLLLNTFIWATDSQSWVPKPPMEHLAVSGDMDVCKQELFKTFNYLPQMLVVPRLRKPALSFFCLITQLSALPLYLFCFICSEFCHTLKWNSHGFTRQRINLKNIQATPPAALPLYFIDTEYPDFLLRH